MCWCVKGRHENPCFFWFLSALQPTPSVSLFPSFFPSPHLPALTSASQSYPAAFFLLSEVGKHGEEDVMAPALRCSSVSQCTKIVWTLPPTYHRFSPNLWAVGLPNIGYRLGSEAKGHLMLSSPVTTQTSGVNSAANIYFWEGERRLMLNCGFLFIFQSAHCECQTIVLQGKMRKKDLCPCPDLLDELRFLGSSSCEQCVSFQCIATMCLRRGIFMLLHKVHPVIPS